MTAQDVIGLLRLLEELGVGVRIDGGWAVDACLGRQTRRHEDLDIVIEERNVSAAAEALRQRGFMPVPRDDTRAWNFVLADDAGHEVDFHVVVRDEGGRGIYGPPENAEFYPAEALTGRGLIGGVEVACTTPQWLVATHTGYAIDETDWADVSALCEAFGLPVPVEYEEFEQVRDRS